MAQSSLCSSYFPTTFWVLAGARLAFSFIGVPGWLRQNHLVSSPLTSALNLQEGIYLFKHGIDPYSGGSFRHPPLLLVAFATIIPPTQAAPLFALFDIIGAAALIRLWRARQNPPASGRDGLIAACYLLNPYLIFPNLALSTSSLENMFVLLMLMFASRGKRSSALLCVAALVQLSPSHLVMLLPVSMSLIVGPHSRLADPYQPNIPRRTLLSMLGEFFGYSIVLTSISCFTTGNWTWIPQTWGASLLLPDLTPNPGLWWYFFTEMFDHFRSFFLMVFTVHLFIHVLPICLKFQYDPVYATFCLLGVMGLFKAYPTLADSGLFISMLSVFPEIYPYLRHPIVTTLLHLHASLLMPLFHSLWLRQGTGNANFFYASTLVFACANGAAVIDCIWAGLRIALGPSREKYVIIQE